MSRNDIAFAFPQSGTQAKYGQYPNYNQSLGPVKKTKTVKIGGVDTFSLRGTTLVEGYFPGPMRQNFRQDPIYMIGQVDFGTFGNDQNYNGPGTLMQALPDASRYQYRQIFAKPRPTINKEVGIDDRQIASYQVEQLNNNPLSQYTTNPNAPIPGFFYDSQPETFQTMTNERSNQTEKWFKEIEMKPNNWSDASQIPGRSAGSAINVYEQYQGQQVNPNAAIVFNMSLNTEEEFNPLISSGSSRSVATSQPDFTGKGYSGNFVPDYPIHTNGGINQPNVYGGNVYRNRDPSDVGMMNNSTSKVCEPNRSLSFANPLILNNY
jgi:hypothetical protein